MITKQQRLIIDSMAQDVVKVMEDIDHGNSSILPFYLDGTVKYRLFEVFRLGLTSVIYDPTNDRVMTVYKLTQEVNTITSELYGTWAFSLRNDFIEDHNPLPTVYDAIQRAYEGLI